MAVLEIKQDLMTPFYVAITVAIKNKPTSNAEKWIQPKAKKLHLNGSHGKRFALGHCAF